MLSLLKKLNLNNELIHGNYGVEREALRTLSNGNLALTPHPKAFGEKVMNPYITTDFSESQLELITPVFNSLEETYDFLNILYDIVALELEDEYIWPQSMPCIIPDDDNIPIADFCKCEKGEQARKYREKLFQKYGGKKQLISGIHYNFSFNQTIFEKLYTELQPNKSYKTFKDSLNLKVVRNYLRYRWLLIYLFGGTAVVHDSYSNSNRTSKNDDYSVKKCMTSYRNSQCGYKNHTDLFPDYSTIESYTTSINNFISDNLISDYKELYSQIRIKPYNNDNTLNSLVDDGINYLEIRSIDINPYDKAGISLDDLKFVNLFTIFLLIKEESDYKDWQKQALDNQEKIARCGLCNLELMRDNQSTTKVDWAEEILDELLHINNEFDFGLNNIIEQKREQVLDTKKTYSYRITQDIQQSDYIKYHIDLAKKYVQTSYNARFKMHGYSDLELSTQILLKESIKQGKKFDILDRSDNFISISNCKKTEYIKQATKTSLDTYATVLMMENKVVTKKILKKNNINVPEGTEYFTLESAIKNVDDIIGKPIVIKPKSTNFGTGISIYPNGTNKNDLIESLKIAFKFDTTVLVEEFIKGKEYRFLVIGDEVAGILHRVPANVVGNGSLTIEQLVEEKNKNPLRGKGYVTPLEKIVINDTVKLFLKNQGLNTSYVPKKDEIIYLRENSNVSTGGDSIDFTDDIDDFYKEIAIKASKAVDATICGVDLMIEDIYTPKDNYSIIELNFNPAIHIHSYPFKGKERNIAKKIITALNL